MPYADELDRYLHCRADRRALRTLRDRHPDQYAAAYEAERQTILGAMAAKGALAAPVPVVALEPDDERRDADASGESKTHVAHATKDAPPPIICNVCTEVVPRTGRQGAPRRRHESCQVKARTGVSRETSPVQDGPMVVISLPSPPPSPKPASLTAPVRQIHVSEVRKAPEVSAVAVIEAPETAQPIYLRDPSAPPDDPEWIVCRGCGYGLNPQTLSCGCQIGVLGDDDAPLDERFRYLGPNDDY